MKHLAGSSRRFTGHAAGGVALAMMLASVGIASIATAAEEVRAGTFEIHADPILLNQASDPGLGKLTPSVDAAENGMFGPQVDWPLIPLHTSLARDGHLVSYGTPLGNGLAQAGFSYDNWNPYAGFSSAAHAVSDSMVYDGFCSSSIMLADRRMLMLGGQTSNGTMIYDPATRTHAMGSQLNRQRWYATTLRLSDGRLLALGGVVPGLTGSYLTPEDNASVATVPEVFDGTSWSVLAGADSTQLFGAERNRWWYPRAFNAGDSVVGFSGDRIWMLDATGAGEVRRIGTLTYDPGVSGSEVMYAPGKVLLAGGGQMANADQITASAESSLVDFAGGGSPSVRAGEAMHHPRNWLNLSVLPTGLVFANGGTVYGTADGEANSIKQAELWDPATNRWALAATAARTRTYHSVSALLPSGALFTGGGGAAGNTDSNGRWGPENNLNAELYYPPYLFEKDGDGHVSWASRPAINSISGSAIWGGSLRLGVFGSSNIAQASLISLPNVTHSQNTNQRRIPLEISRQGGEVVAQLPDETSLPAGDYELTVVDERGVPSAAQIITIQKDGPGLITIPDQSTPTPAVPAEDHAQHAQPSSMADEMAHATPSQPSTSSQFATPSQPSVTATPEASAPIITPAPVTTPRPSSREVDKLRAKAVVQLGISPSSALGVKAGSIAQLRLRGHAGATSWRVRVKVAEGASRSFAFESIAKPGFYLVRDGSKLGLVRKRGAGLPPRAYFIAREGLAKSGISLGQQVQGSVSYITVSAAGKVAVKQPDAKRLLASTLRLIVKGSAVR